MNLQQFVETALVDVVRGVEQANSTLQKRNGVWPFGLSPGQQASAGQGIEFDVAVTVAKKGSAKAKTGGWLEVVGLSASGDMSASSQQVSRVRFRVSTEAWITAPQE